MRGTGGIGPVLLAALLFVASCVLERGECATANVTAEQIQAILDEHNACRAAEGGSDLYSLVSDNAQIKSGGLV